MGTTDGLFLQSEVWFKLAEYFLMIFYLNFLYFLYWPKKKKLKCVVDGKTVNGKPQNIYVRASYEASLYKEGCHACDYIVVRFVPTYHY